GTRQRCLVLLPAVIGRKLFTVTRIGLQRRRLSPLHPHAPNLFPVGRQKLFRRHAAVLGASVNDNCPFGREGGSHRAIRQCVKTLSGLRLAAVSV
ncbi:MAG: hypothetical protein QOD10_2381, partial [Mycobacterium sp.]|nr:hypothetical protein [Mycobacterium sp.]